MSTRTKLSGTPSSQRIKGIVASVLLRRRYNAEAGGRFRDRNRNAARTNDIAATAVRSSSLEGKGEAEQAVRESGDSKTVRRFLPPWKEPLRVGPFAHVVIHAVSRDVWRGMPCLLFAAMTAPAPSHASLRSSHSGSPGAAIPCSHATFCLHKPCGRRRGVAARARPCRRSHRARRGNTPAAR